MDYGRVPLCVASRGQRARDGGGCTGIERKSFLLNTIYMILQNGYLKLDLVERGGVVPNGYLEVCRSFGAALVKQREHDASCPLLLNVDVAGEDGKILFFFRFISMATSKRLALKRMGTRIKRSLLFFCTSK